MQSPTSKTQSSPTPIITKIINELVENRKDEIEKWFESTFANTPPFFYNSVDLRNSGYKIAPVDTNLFPAGFNNLNEGERERAIKVTDDFFKKHYPDAQNILLIAEDHTRNLYYLENLAILSNIISKTGRNLVLTNFATATSGETTEFTSHSGKPVKFTPIVKHNGKVMTFEGFIPDIVIVNNDLTSGAPDIITDIEQPVSPPVGFGWYQRRKTSHFDTYNNLARDFCYKFNIDPWLITTYFEHCGVVNFKERKGIECVALNVDKTLAKIQAKYDEYGIKEQPYVFIKSDRGTYGMGIMTARSGDELFDMNKDVRKKMNAIKGGNINTEVIIQEGVPTVDTVDNNPAEPMIYLIGSQPVGCIYRLNTKKSSYENLNASGMQFTSISEQNGGKKICNTVGLISRLAAYSSAWECYSESYSI